MAGSLLGTEVRRVEDPHLLRGQARYVDNLRIDGVLHLAFVRSPFAHAVITGIDTQAAAEAGGVVAVYTAADLDPPPVQQFLKVHADCARSALATDRVRFVGEPVAVVVAETAAAAADALELVDVDYDPLPVVADPEEALRPDAPVQFPGLGTNVAAGERDAAGEEVLADADVVVRARIENQRVAAVPLEGNAIVVVPGGPDEEFDLTLYVSTQSPHSLWSAAARAYGLPRDRVRVVAPDVGGAFGGKFGFIAEHLVAVSVARALARPVKWVETRSENLQAMPHGRAQIQYAELGLSRDGVITGLRCRMLGDCGAYAGYGGGFVLGPTRMMAQGVYRIPKLSYAAIAALTNTTPTGAFRGAGRPEAAALLERMMDLAAAELDIDPVDLRRRNLLQPDEFPYTTLVGAHYDSGDYDRALAEALRIVDYEELRREQARRVHADASVVLGIGVSTYVEITGGGGSGEYASVEVDTDGRATIKVGTSGHGQGHPTSFAMLVADTLGIPLDAVDFVQSDTARVPRGGGTGGSRSLQLGGSAVREASELLVQRAKELAAARWEAAVEDIEFTEGRFGVAGVPDTSVSWAELACFAAEESTALDAHTDFAPGGATFPFGAHVSVVEVDLETGMVRPLRHVAVDDCGRVLNPMIVQGQQHGGAVQGISQALWEQMVFDPDGNPVTGTLADYPVPSAMEIPVLETETPHNPLGAKGIGESATIGSTPAVQNAVLDALRHLGVRHIDMPLTPQRVWQAIADARAGNVSSPWREPPQAFDDLPVRGAGQ